MRSHATSILSASLLALGAITACHGASQGAQEAEQEAKAEQARAAKNGEVAKKIQPPVPGMAKIPCSQLIDPAAFTTALEEKEPLTVKDLTNTVSEAASSCSLVRGGKPVSAAEQAARLKKGRLGVLPGDEVCNITAFCWTLEDADKFKAKCAEKKLKDDESMGSYACLQVVAQGEDDVFNFKFLDPDTKCLFEVRGGPGMTDNAYITTCAKAARDLIGPAQIAVKPPEPK
jgi:hypothetical protein